MGYIGMGSMASQPAGNAGSSNNIATLLYTRVKEMERRLNRAELMNRAIWELIATSANLTEEDLEKRIKEIDLRDGVDDDKISVVPLRCPTCKRVSSSKHWRCLYCGQEFEKYSY